MAVMDLMPEIMRRFSVRKYKDTEIPRAAIEGLIEAARIAPSASNRQEWRFIVVEDQAKRSALSQAALGQNFVSRAPVVIVACAVTDEHVMACGEKCYPIDVAIAMTHIALQATHDGLGVCWVGAFDQQKVKTILGIPEAVKVVEMMTVGYADCDPPAERKRRSLEEILCYDRWSL